MIRALAALAATLFVVAAAAQERPAQANQAPRPAPLGLGQQSKEPIKIDADRLDVFDKEQRAVFTGNVVAVQGETTINCAELTVLYEQQRGQGPRRPAAGAQGDSAIRRIDCKGPVTVVSRDQVAAGDSATFDRVANRVVLTGNVSLSQCDNVTRGNRLVYDLNNGVANLEGAPATGGRVQALLSPGGRDSAPKQGCQQGGQPAPPAKVAAPAPQPASPQPAAAQAREPKQQPPKPPTRRPPQTN